MVLDELCGVGSMQVACKAGQDKQIWTARAAARKSSWCSSCPPSNLV